MMNASYKRSWGLLVFIVSVAVVFLSGCSGTNQMTGDSSMPRRISHSQVWDHDIASQSVEHIDVAITRLEALLRDSKQLDAVDENEALMLLDAIRRLNQAMGEMESRYWNALLEETDPEFSPCD